VTVEAGGKTAVTIFGNVVPPLDRVLAHPILVLQFLDLLERRLRRPQARLGLPAPPCWSRELPRWRSAARIGALEKKRGPQKDGVRDRWEASA
jgi:hypothetical protein